MKNVSIYRLMMGPKELKHFIQGERGCLCFGRSKVTVVIGRHTGRWLLARKNYLSFGGKQPHSLTATVWPRGHVVGEENIPT